MKNDGFAERLKELRRHKNLSQTELGKLVGIHYNHIGRYERGNSMPSTDALKRLAEALGITADFLLYGEINEAAKAKMDDKELLQLFKEVEKLPEEDKNVARKVLEAILAKRKIQDIIKS
jgi:transcriptional regulator with XRE-family HTH domain